MTYPGGRLAALLCALTLFAVPFAAFGQTLEFGDITTGAGLGIGARALAMGGAYTAMADDIAALYWCPAGLAYADGFHIVGLANGTATNIDVVDDLSDLVDILDDSGDLTVGDILDLIRIARKAKGKEVTANIGALAGIQGGQWALGAWGRGVGSVELDMVETATSIDVWAGAASNPRTQPAHLVGAYSFGAGYGWKIGQRTALGVVVRQMTVDYRQARAEGHVVRDARGKWSVSDTSEVTEVFDDDDDDFTADIGLMYEPEPRVRFALTVRNLFGPDFDLRDIDEDTGQPRHIRIKTEPSVDIGMAVWSRNRRLAVAFDVHNISGSDSADPTVHVGLRYRCCHWLALMAGASHQGTTFGVEMNFGPLTLVGAMGEDWEAVGGARFELSF